MVATKARHVDVRLMVVQAETGTLTWLLSGCRSVQGFLLNHEHTWCAVKMLTFSVTFLHRTFLTPVLGKKVVF